MSILLCILFFIIFICLFIVTLYEKMNNRGIKKTILIILMLAMTIIFILTYDYKSDVDSLGAIFALEAILFFGILIITGLLKSIYKDIKPRKYDKKVKLLTDTEIFIAQLNIRPKKNIEIKKLAEYIDSIIMPNEEILAIASEKSTYNVFNILTDKRIIQKGILSNELVKVLPIEKINTICQNGNIVFTDNILLILDTSEIATEFTNIINQKISSYQTLGQTIKIENKIITEETIASQIKKLSDLHDSRILTDYEFSIKKQELLEKMK